MSLYSEGARLSRIIQRVVSHASSLSTAEQLKDGDDKIFELYASFTAILELRGHGYNISLENLMTTKGKLRLPLSPATKSQFPYFKATKKHGATSFQICIGTKISNAAGTTFAPDISFQIGPAGLSPNGGDILFCWDHKYQKSGGTLNRDEVSKVYGHLTLIRPYSPSTLAIFPNLSEWPNGDAIVTNAEYSTLKNSDLANFNMNEVADVYPGKAKKVRP